MGDCVYEEQYTCNQCCFECGFSCHSGQSTIHFSLLAFSSWCYMNGLYSYFNMQISEDATACYEKINMCSLNVQTFYYQCLFYHFRLLSRDQKIYIETAFLKKNLKSFTEYVEGNKRDFNKNSQITESGIYVSVLSTTREIIGFA